MSTPGAALPHEIRRVLGRLARVRFTWALLALLYVVAAWTGSLTHRLEGLGLLQRYGYGLPALEHGRLETLITSTAFALFPWMLATITVIILIFTVPYEMVAGGWRAAFVFFASQIGGYLLASLLVAWPLDALGVPWGHYLATARDVGASAGAFGCGGALVWHLPPRWRRAAALALAAYFAFFLLVTHRVWDVEHAFAGLVGFGLGGWLKTRERREPRRGFHAFRSTPRMLIAGLVTLIGGMNVIAALVHRGNMHLWSWTHLVPFTVLHGTRTFVVLAGIFLVLLGNGLLHGRRTAWAAALVLLGGVTVSHLLRGFDPGTTGVTVGAIALLLWRGHDFRARPDVPTLARALRVASLALGLLVVYVALGFVTLRGQFAPVPTAALVVRQALERMAFLSGPIAGATWKGRWFLDSITFAWGGVLAFSLFQVLRPVLRPIPDTPRDREQAGRLLRGYGLSTTSYMTTWPGNTILLDGARNAYLAYRLIGGVALVLGDPVGTPEGCARVIDEFVDLAAENGWTPCFYGATRPLLPEYARHGLAALQVGEDATIDLPSLAFRGKAWQDVRTAINRARREGIDFRLIDQASADPGIVRQLRTISSDWMAERKLPEMGFTLGKLEDPPDPEVRTAVAIDGTGRVEAFATWLPVYAEHGWVIDIMRRRDDAFPGVMEFLIAQSALAFKAEGAAFVSLSAAPLAWVSRDSEGRVLERALTVVGNRLDALYNFGSLYDFKRKFQPRWEPLYLVHPGATSLPRIGYAILRAYLPELSLEDVRLLLVGAIDVVPRPRRGRSEDPRGAPVGPPEPGRAPDPVGVGARRDPEGV